MYSELLQKTEQELRIRGFSPKTVKSYIFHIEKFLNYYNEKNKSLKFVSKMDVKEYIDYMLRKGNKSTTINLMISSLKFFFINVAGKKLMYSIKRLRCRKYIPVVLKKEEILKMIEAAENPKHRLLIELLYSSGLRVSEAAKFRICSIKDNFALVESGKGNKDRYILLSERFITDLNSYLLQRKNYSDYLFNTRRGHYSVGTAERIVKEAARNAGIKSRVFCHALRSSFATHLIENNVDLLTVKRLLGHERIQTTQGYIKCSSNFIGNVKSPIDR
jgi:integrase/recombinase XerD